MLKQPKARIELTLSVYLPFFIVLMIFYFWKPDLSILLLEKLKWLVIILSVTLAFINSIKVKNFHSFSLSINKLLSQFWFQQKFSLLVLFRIAAIILAFILLSTLMNVFFAASFHVPMQPILSFSWQQIAGDLFLTSLWLLLYFNCVNTPSGNSVQPSNYLQQIMQAFNHSKNIQRKIIWCCVYYWQQSLNFWFGITLAIIASASMLILPTGQLIQLLIATAFIMLTRAKQWHHFILFFVHRTKMQWYLFSTLGGLCILMYLVIHYTIKLFPDLALVRSPLFLLNTLDHFMNQHQLWKMSVLTWHYLSTPILAFVLIPFIKQKNTLFLLMLLAVICLFIPNISYLLPVPLFDLPNHFMPLLLLSLMSLVLIGVLFNHNTLLSSQWIIRIDTKSARSSYTAIKALSISNIAMLATFVVNSIGFSSMLGWLATVPLILLLGLFIIVCLRPQLLSKHT